MRYIISAIVSAVISTTAISATQTDSLAAPAGIMEPTASDAAISEEPASASIDIQADEAYMQGDFNKAISLYKKAIEQEGTSAAIYYNLGNSYYRVDSLAKAILNYERALRLDPTDDDIRFNLDFVNSKIEDAPATDKISNILVDKSLRMFTPNGWAIVSLAVFALAIGCAAVYIFSSNIRMRKIFFFVGLTLIFVDILCIVVTVKASSISSDSKQAIIMVKSTQLSTSPSSPVDAAQKATLLHEGTKITIIRQLATPNDPEVKNWWEVEIGSEGTHAWIDAEDIEII